MQRPPQLPWAAILTLSLATFAGVFVVSTTTAAPLAPLHPQTKAPEPASSEPHAMSHDTSHQTEHQTEHQTQSQSSEEDPHHHAHGHEGHEHGTGKHEKHGHEKHGHGSEGMQHDFSDAERWFRIFEGDDRDQWQKPAEVARLMEIEPGMTVADIGAGTGYFLPHLASEVGADGIVLGLDPEENLVEFMKQRAKKESWTQVEIRQIPFDTPELMGDSTDRILIVNTWHHIDDRSSYAATLGKALRQDGRVYVVDFTKESPYGPSVKHRLPPEQVIEELRRGGLTAEVLETDLSWQYVVVAQLP